MMPSANRLRLRRVCPGVYSDGRWRVIRVVYPHNGQIAWYWQDGQKDVDDHYPTKRQAVEALNWFASK